MRSKFQMALLSGLFIVFFAACNAPAEKAEAIDMDKLKVEIQAMEDAFSAAEKAKDAAAVVAYYADDAISYSRNQEPAVGKAAIQTKIAENLAKDSAGTTNVYKVVDLFAEGNMAVEIGSFSHLDPAGTEVDKGFYMSYFQKRDGKYVCVRDMNVTTLPAKSPM
ncbi:MAG: DUF4440 domain-containing protein [Terrimonas sp.]|nr:DUF4440 domain-containing protein [Terrimonas sp.]